MATGQRRACERLIAQAAAIRRAAGGEPEFRATTRPSCRLRELVESGALGRPSFVTCIYNVPLRQMAARQFGHWMFLQPDRTSCWNRRCIRCRRSRLWRAPIGDGAGDVAGPAHGDRARSVPFYPSLTRHPALAQRLPASAALRGGPDLPVLAGQRRCATTAWRWPTCWPTGCCAMAARAGWRCRTHCCPACPPPADWRATAWPTPPARCCPLLKLRPRSDPFFRSMRDSIAAFHAAVDAGRAPALDGQFGADLVAACERLAHAAFPVGRAPAPCARAVACAAAAAGPSTWRCWAAPASLARMWSQQLLDGGADASR